MLKFRNFLTAATAFAALTAAAHAGDPAAGEKVFNKCKACHAVGEGAKNKSGPVLNNLMGRAAGSVEGFKYSSAMKESGVTWDAGTLASYLKDPKGFVPKNKMSFAGLKTDDDVNNVIAYLATFSAAAAPAAADEKKESAAPAEPAKAAEAAPAAEPTKVDEKPAAMADVIPSRGKFGLGRQATDDEIAAWDVKVMPNGKGLPPGQGSVEDGEAIFSEKCAVCHGEFAEGVDNWPKLAGGDDTLADEDPLKTVGSYWPYLSTTWDYVHRSMPFGNAGTLTADETYAIVAYILYSNNLVEDDFVLSNENFTSVKMRNAGGFIVDDRAETEYKKWRAEPCMENCKDEVKITRKATVLDVTPD
ncbi:MAG: c-type cytochrome [Notoacmeibacter sp.]|nr:c-type cytochrome [Notoacmeibacter sp.]